MYLIIVIQEYTAAKKIHPMDKILGNSNNFDCNATDKNNNVIISALS